MECHWHFVSRGVCPRCRGEGDVDEIVKPVVGTVPHCRRCGGTGSVVVEPVDCPDCGGERLLAGPVACARCDSTGLIAPRRR